MDKSRSAATNRLRGRWMLRTVLALGWTTMVGALDLGPDVAQWKSAVEAASPGTAISFRPGFYHGCNVASPAGLAARYSFLTNHVAVRTSALMQAANVIQCNSRRIGRMTVRVPIYLW